MRLSGILGLVFAAWWQVSTACAVTDMALLGLKGDDRMVSETAEAADSMRVITLLNEARALSNHQSNILFFAKGFLGTPYAGGTLETYPNEHLVVRTDSVDCTTFVEYVLSLATVDYLTDVCSLHQTCDSVALVNKQFMKRFNSDTNQELVSTNGYTLFKKVLQTLRYRKGVLDGYTSRLHYFSDWILDNECKGLVKEVTKESPYEVREVDLNFMGNHASLYPFLAHDSMAVRRMRTIESKWKSFQMAYIPKEKLNLGQDVLKIQDGDIITLVTNIKGLDVVHVGFACWMDGVLHLFHASSAKKHVLLDPVPLYQYSKNIKSHIGIRVIRPIR